MSQPNSATGQPTSFNTNVNRAKTKKWVEAKSYSYDGDDWGEVDDYDEYGTYNKLEPAPRPTGLRQRGQSATQRPQEGYGAGQDMHQSPVDARQPYGSLAGAPQQQHGGRSVTNPQFQGQPSMVRTNSFDQGDERRAFSAGGPQKGMGGLTTGTYPAPQAQSNHTVTQEFQPSPMSANPQLLAQPNLAGPALQIPNRSSMEMRARNSDQTYSAGGALRGPQFLDQQRQGSRTHSMTSNNSSLDFHNRRDFSPSAMPPPLHTRGSPSPQSNPDSRSSSQHPPRKSSLSQDNPPYLPLPAQGAPMATARDLEEDLPVARERASSGASKPLPFVRPADIYRRMQEEKEREKERQSQESSRPSMDSVLGKQNDVSIFVKPQDADSAQRLKPTLEPVSERKVEYGMEGVNISGSVAPEERRPITSKKFDLPSRESNSSSKPLANSLPQMLPDVSRVSGFGESFFGPADTSGGSFPHTMLNLAGSSPEYSTQELTQTAPGKDLQHQPSLGFTSAVHQAFDKAEEQVPPTPSSATASTVGRSASDGTSAVSPIISRGPSAATDRLPRIEDVTTPTIAEGPEDNLRPRSLGSPSTLRQFAPGTPITHGTEPESAEPPPSFVPGHRRNLSTPSPDNSPARTPAVEATRQLRQPQEVEIAAASPTDSGCNAGGSSQDSEIAQEDYPIVPRTMDPPSMESDGRSIGTHGGVSNTPTMFDQTASSTPASQNGRHRTDSSSSSRVRNLADKFEGGSRPGSAHSTTPRASLLSTATEKRDDLTFHRPIADRMESFRPRLPGGWESSASLPTAAGPSRMETTGAWKKPDGVDSSAAFTPSLKNVSTKPEDERPVPPHQPPSSVSQIKDASEEAFTALAAAGSALSGAFAAAVGMDDHNSSVKSNVDMHGLQEMSEDLGQSARDRKTLVNTVVHPEASRAVLPSMADDELSSNAPTPFPQSIERNLATTSKDPEYFPPPLSVHLASPVRASTSREASPAKQQPTLPPLTTDTKPRQYESDRLRKEIVRELTPLSPSEPTTAETDYSAYQESRISTEPSLSRPGHESGVLPKEYESYWNDANSDDEFNGASPETSHLENTTTTESQKGASPESKPLIPELASQQTPMVSVLREQPSQATSLPRTQAFDPQGESTQERPPVLPHRFSWEQPLHDLSAVTNSSEEPTVAPVSDFLKSAVYPEGRSFQPQVEPSKIQTQSLPTEISPVLNDPPRPPEKDLAIANGGDTPSFSSKPLFNQKGLPNDPPGLEVAPSVAEKDQFERLAAGDADNVNSLIQPDAVGLQESRIEENALPEPAQQATSPSTVPHTYPDNSILPTVPPKIPAFREIVALKTPSERIRGFNDARDQFARLPVGLSAWVNETLRQLPEHEDLLVTTRRPIPGLQGHKSSPSRSKLGGLLSGGGQTGQQPQSQQYLGVISQSAAPNGSPQSGAAIGGSLQGNSSPGGSAGKISSQQVQAKGKDLLHTAGVFGGKANVAAKGLFSKGKSKFRAASGAEKV